MGAAQHKAAALGERAHAAAELATGQKLAAVAASAAALAGGGTAVEQLADQTTQRPPAAAEPQRQEPVKDEVAVETAPAGRNHAARRRGSRHSPPPRPSPSRRRQPVPEPEPGDRVRPGGRRRGSATAPTRTRRAQRAAAGRRPGAGRRGGRGVRPVGIGPDPSLSSCGAYRPHKLHNERAVPWIRSGSRASDAFAWEPGGGPLRIPPPAQASRGISTHSAMYGSGVRTKSDIRVSRRITSVLTP